MNDEYQYEDGFYYGAIFGGPSTFGDTFYHRADTVKALEAIGARPLHDIEVSMGVMGFKYHHGGIASGVRYETLYSWNPREVTKWV